VSSSEHVFERWRRRNLAPTARRSNLNARDSFGSRRREGERAESEGPSVGSFLSRPRPDEPGIECRKMCFFGGALESVRATGMKATAYSLRRDAQSSFFREAAPGVLPRLKASWLEASRPCAEVAPTGVAEDWAEVSQLDHADAVDVWCARGVSASRACCTKLVEVRFGLPVRAVGRRFRLFDKQVWKVRKARAGRRPRRRGIQA
jgi:hypothetical protein